MQVSGNLSLLVIVASILAVHSQTRDCVSSDDCTKANWTENDYRRRAYQTSNCFCDRSCALFGDCCSDAEAAGSTVVGQSTGFTFACGPLTQIRTLGGVLLSIYHVATCPMQKLADESNRRNCENPPNVSDVKLRLPVHARNHGAHNFLVFKNRYCAECNGVNNYETWNMGIVCDLKGDPNYVWNETMMQDFNATEFYEAILRGESIQNPYAHRCAVSYSPRTFDDLDSMPFCKPVESISNCSSPKATAEVKEKCRNGPNQYRYKQEGIDPVAFIFRNQFCGICAEIPISNLRSCQPNYKPARAVTYMPMSLTILFDMRNDKPVQVRTYGRTDNEVAEFYSENMESDFDCVNGTRINNSCIYNETAAQSTPSSDMPVGVILTQVCVSISILALILEVIVIIWTGAYRRGIGSKLMLYLCGTLIVHYLLFFGFSPPGSTLCAIRAVLLDLSTKCVFLWMQVLIFDILRAMWPGKSGANLHDSVKRADQRKRLIKYCAYVYGLPWLFTGPAIIIDSTDRSLSVAPRFGERVCYYSSPGGILVFQYIPLCIVFITNLVLCALTIKYIRSVKKMRKGMLTKPTKGGAGDDDDDAKKQKETREQTYLYLRLILLAGVTWTFGLVNAFWRNRILDLLTILCEGLLGLFVALSFIFARSTLIRLRAKLLCDSEQYSSGTGTTDLANSSSAARQSSHSRTISKV